jgi:DNA-binding ferritin-like protein (Dps family)
MKKLTKTSRYMVYLSLFISGLVIFTGIFYFINAKGGGQGKERWLLIIIVIIAVLAIVSMVVSRMRIRKNTSNLSAEFFSVYEEISDKLGGAMMGAMEKKETLSDILDLFLLADHDGRKVTQVIDGDVDAFIDQIQQSFGYRNKWIFMMLSGVQYCMLYLFMLQGANYIKALPNASFFDVTISLSSFIYLIPLAFIGIPLIKHFMKKNKFFWVVGVPLIILGSFIAMMETMYKYFTHIPWVQVLLDGEVNCVPNISILIVWISVFLLASILKWVQRKTSIRQL